MFIRESPVRATVQAAPEGLSICNERAATVVPSCENPDFMCERLTGNEAGVELTRFSRDPPDGFREKVLGREEHIEAYKALETIHNLIRKSASYPPFVSS